MYNVKIKDAISPILKKTDISSMENDKLDVLSFNSGIGFLVAAIKRNNTILIRRCTYNHNTYLNDLCYASPPMISCGRNHCLIYGKLKDCDISSLITFGNNIFGQCANEMICMENKPSTVSINNDIIQIECGLDHSLIVTNTKQVFSCGLGTDGQTGLSKLDNVAVFSEIKFPDPATKVIKLSSRADTVLAITTNRQVYGWGNNEYGQILGNSSDLQRSMPVILHLSDIGDVVDVLAIGSMCFVTTEANKIFGWGYGTINGVTNQWREPTEIKLFSSDGSIVNEKISIIKGSVHYGVVKTESGRLFIIGNYPGCQIRPTTNEIILPGPVSDVTCDIDRIFLTIH